MIHNKKVIAIIEARMGSKRLPGKVFLSLNGKPVLERIIERIIRSKYVDHIVIATTTEDKDQSIINFCEKNGHCYYKGSENDVLRRVYESACTYNADIVVSVTGDCPCIDHKHIDHLLGKMKASKLLQCATNYGRREWPNGFDIAACTIQALYTAHKNNTSIREHSLHNVVSLYEKLLYHYSPPNFKMYWPNLRLTLDTGNDYKLLRKIFNYFGEQDFSAEDIIDFVKSNSKKLEIYNHLEEKI